MRVAIVGSYTWTDLAMVRGHIRDLPAGTIVLVGDEHGPVEMAAAREAGCRGLVCFMVRAARRAQNPRQSVVSRDSVMYADAHKILCFGALPDYRESALAAAPGAKVQRLGQ